MAENITVVGTVAGDPEQRPLPGGGKVTSFRLACTHRRLDQGTSTWVDAYTNWYNVSAFRGLGENAYDSLRKGDRVLVSGRFRLRAWERDGKTGIAADIEADSLGHDLRWGTTTFHRTSGAAETRVSAAGSVAPPDEGSQSASGPPAEAQSASGQPAEGWGAPAQPAEGAWPAPGAQPELATAGETPF